VREKNMNKTLLVDKNYMALSIISLRKTIKLLVKGKAEPVETGKKNDRFITTAKGSFNIPSIVRLLVNIPWRAHKSRMKFSRRSVMIRDNYRCFYCDKTLGSHSKTIDHIVPKSQGGPTTYNNCVACCKACNNKKADKSVEQIGFVLKEKPKRPSFITLYRSHLQGYSPDEWRIYIIGV